MFSQRYRYFPILSFFGLISISCGTARAECTTVITTWEVVEAIATGINAAGAVSSNGNFGSRVVSGVGVAAGLSSLTTEGQELELINNARLNKDSEAIREMHALVTIELARIYPGQQTISRQELNHLISLASAQNAICSRWYGARPFSMIAAEIAEMVPKATKKVVAQENRSDLAGTTVEDNTSPLAAPAN